MKHSTIRKSSGRRASASRQRGVVLLFSLIALGIMLIVAVALVRSFNSSLFTAGNIGFKRDMQNQSEYAVDQVLNEFRSTGNLATAAARSASSTTYNYSATMLDVNAHGIPDALQPANYATYATVQIPRPGGIRIFYVIDRLCSAAGDENTLGASKCRLANNPVPAGTSLSNLQGADRAPLCPTCASAAPQGVVYRLSVMVNGPRNTQSFFQSTFTVPSTL